jgi:acetyl esterase/lipase
MKKPLRGILVAAGWMAIVIATARSDAQEFIPLWPADAMPNSRGIMMQDSIVNERIVQVGTPGMYVFLPPAQENKGCAVVICPGGGYQRLAYTTAGLQFAKWFNTMGVSAFVLKYRLPHSPDAKQRDLLPLQDAQRAMRLVRANCTRWGIAPNRIGVIGTSAGGHLAAMLATFENDVSMIGDSLGKLTFRPDFQILVSPVITMKKYTHDGSRDNLLGPSPTVELLEKYSLETRVSHTTPPAFIVHAFNDKAVPLQNSLMFYQALLDHGIPSSLHIFPEGGHSIALRNNPGSTAFWTTLCEEWLREMAFIAAVKAEGR